MQTIQATERDTTIRFDDGSTVTYRRIPQRARPYRTPEQRIAAELRAEVEDLGGNGFGFDQFLMT